MDDKPIFDPLSPDDAKDIIINKLMKDLEITERWIREHVAGERHASDKSMIAVADALSGVYSSYSLPAIVAEYSALKDVAFYARMLLNSIRNKEEIDPVLVERLREYINQTSSVK